MAAPAHSNPVFTVAPGTIIQGVTLTSHSNDPWANATASVSYSADPVEGAPTDAQGMSPTDFVIWLNGAIDVLSEAPPTQEQWDKMRERIAGQVGAIVSQRIRAAAQTTYADPNTKTGAAYAASYQAQMLRYQKQVAEQMAKADEYRRLAEVEMAAYKAQVLTTSGLVQSAMGGVSYSGETSDFSAGIDRNTLARGKK